MNGRGEINFLDSSNTVFHHFQSVLDGQIKRLTAEGYDRLPNQARGLTLDDEDKIWQMNIVGKSSASGFQTNHLLLHR